MTYFKACEIASDIGYLVVCPDGRKLIPVISDDESEFELIYPDTRGLASMTASAIISNDWEICVNEEKNA